MRTQLGAVIQAHTCARGRHMPQCMALTHPKLDHTAITAGPVPSIYTIDSEWRARDQEGPGVAQETPSTPYSNAHTAYIHTCGAHSGVP